MRRPLQEKRVGADPIGRDILESRSDSTINRGENELVRGETEPSLIVFDCRSMEFCFDLTWLERYRSIRFEESVS